MTRRVAAAWILTFAAAMGCGKGGPERFAISGQVTFDGQPLPDGDIMLRPDAGTKGPTAAAMIENGAFSIAEDKGPVAGTYQVVITAMRKTGKQVQSEMGSATKTDQLAQYVPAKYNDRSELTVSIDAERDDVNFALTSK